MKQPILSISLLVSGREETTGKCLESIRELLMQLDSELILVDTGCSEELRSRLAEYTDQIIPFTWCDDFAKARNAGLEKASGEWFLFLDDDEWFEDVSPIIDFFKSGEYLQYEQAVYIARNYIRKDGSQYSDDLVSRMIRLTEETHFEGSVHESLVPVGGRCKMLPAYVHHFGYAFDTLEERREHYKRNVTILERLMREEPNNMRWWIQIVPEYSEIGDSVNLIRTAQEALEKIKNVNEPFMNQCRGTFYGAHLIGLTMGKQYGEVQRLCNQYVADERNSQMVNCCLYLFAMRAANASQEQTEEVLKDMAELGAKYFAALDAHDRTVRSEQEKIIDKSLVLVKDAVTENARQEMRILYGESLARLGRSTEYPAALSAELGKYVAHQIETNGEFLTLPETYWELGRAGILPLEDILLACPMEQWLVQISVLEQRNNIGAWKQIQAHLKEIQTREDKRYQIFASRAANAELHAMAGEAKKQVYTLIEAGLQAEALSVVQQLRGMLPEDEELKNLETQLQSM